MLSLKVTFSLVWGKRYCRPTGHTKRKRSATGLWTCSGPRLPPSLGRATPSVHLGAVPLLAFLLLLLCICKNRRKRAASNPFTLTSDLNWISLLWWVQKIPFHQNDPFTEAISTCQHKWYIEVKGWNLVFVWNGLAKNPLIKCQEVVLNSDMVSLLLLIWAFKMLTLWMCTRRKCTESVLVTSAANFHEH